MICNNNYTTVLLMLLLYVCWYANDEWWCNKSCSIFIIGITFFNVCWYANDEWWCNKSCSIFIISITIFNGKSYNISKWSICYFIDISINLQSVTRRIFCRFIIIRYKYYNEFYWSYKYLFFIFTNIFRD